ncbi:MAG: alpha/beta fold hydrolase [Ktedonobacteraceae bacterium]
MKLRRIVTAGLAIGGVVGALAAVNKFTEIMAGELNTVLTGEERRYPWKYGDMFYEVKGERGAKPLLLIHSFAPGTSSYEWRRNIDALARQYRVYVIDLLGFGLSDKPAIDYTPETFTDLIGDFIREVIGKPTVVVAHGLSGAYVIADAYRDPRLFERIVLVTPPEAILEEQTPGLLNSIIKFALRTPVIGQSIYNVFTSRAALRCYYDREGYHNPSLITDDLVEYLFTSAHQPNTRFAMAAVRSRSLTLDVYEAFARLRVPVTIVLGREGVPLPSEVSEAFKRVNAKVDVHILDKCNRQPQDEQAGQFNTLIAGLVAAPVS